MGIKLGKGKVIAKGGKNSQGLEINLSKLDDGGSIRLRLLGEVEPGYRYWVKCTNGKTKPILTPFFDKETEVLSSKDPLLGDGRKEFFYTVNAIDRATGELKILLLKTTIYRSLVSLAQDDEYGDCMDEVTGYDIIITKESTGPLPMNVKYEVRAGRDTTPLTAEEKAMELHDLSEIYAPKSEADYIEWIKMETDILNVVPEVETAQVEAVNTDKDTDIPF